MALYEHLYLARQDLTAQQLKYVLSLLSKVEDELAQVLDAFSSGRHERRIGEVEAVFDPNASFTENRNAQDDVDSIIRLAQENK